jgi:chloramphenicol 3-O phosphotransferase
MIARVIVLNGGSSSGKSSLALCLQSLLPDPWLTLGVDTLIEAMPLALWQSSTGLSVASDGQITSGAAFRALEAAWISGVAAMARAGAGVILDEVFLSGGVAQERWKAALRGLPVLWVGVKCDPHVAAEREAARADRDPGMAMSQAHLVHQGVAYDIEVDTTHTPPEECARIIMDRLG